jgi:two-component system cell cycle response regulator DivK
MTYRVIIQDNYADTLKVLRYRLNKMSTPMTIREATSHAQMVQMVREEKPDLIICEMSKGSGQSEYGWGWKAIRDIRAMDIGADIRILALTSQCMSGDEAAALAAGCDAYIAKPTVTGQVQLKVEELLAAMPKSSEQRKRVNAILAEWGCVCPACRERASQQVEHEVEAE